MNPKLLDLLTKLEPELRKQIPAGAVNASVTISLDDRGATYSFSSSDNLGASESVNKRIVSAPPATTK